LTLALLLSSCTYNNDDQNNIADQPTEPEYDTLPSDTLSNESSPNNTTFIETELGERVIISEEEARERLLAMGWQEEQLEMFAEGNITLSNMYNQDRFREYRLYIHDHKAIGESGEIIAPQYFGGMYFDDMGFLVVSVLPAGLDHPPTATAIDEMLERGIIIRLVQFQYEDIVVTSDRLWHMRDSAFAAGATSWGQGAENAITVQLDPYTDEQKTIFNDFLITYGFNPALFLIQPAVTQEMRDWRAYSITSAIANHTNLIAHIGEVEVSRLEIGFTLENTTPYTFSYGSPWDLARFENGTWLPMTHLPGRGGNSWTSEGRSLQGGGIQHYRQPFDWFFGELPPGRYMFIRDGWLGGWNPDQPRVYALVEFEITDTTPLNLPPEPEPVWNTFLRVAEVSNVTSTGMRIVVENISSYDIDHRLHIGFLVLAEHTTTGEWWEWERHRLPNISFTGTTPIQARQFIPAGERIEFDIDLSILFGELPPGDYKVNLGMSGSVGPPHPTGGIINYEQIAFTVE